MKDPNPLVYTCLPQSTPQHTTAAHTSTSYNTVHRAGFKVSLEVDVRVQRLARWPCFAQVLALVILSINLGRTAP